MNWLLIFCAVLTLSAQASISDSGGVYIGNGGQGVRVNGALVLRDLFQAGIHQRPEFGRSTQTLILQGLEKSKLAGSGLPLDLMARKLTDLDFLVPKFGIYTVRAIEYYDWQFVDEELPQVSAQDPETGFVTLALRELNVIRVHRPSWLELAPEQKVALIVHEIISALMIPSCDARNVCRISNSDVRSTVAMLFSKVGERDVLLVKKLAILFPVRKPTPEIFLRNAIEFIGDEKTAHVSLDDSTKQADAIASVCSLAGKDGLGSALKISFFRYPFQFKTVSYTTDYQGALYRQTHLRAYFAIPNVIRNIESTDWLNMSQQACDADLGKFARDWFSYTWNTKPVVEL